MEAAKGPMKFVRFNSEQVQEPRFPPQQRDPSDVDPREPLPPQPFFPTASHSAPRPRVPFSLENPTAKPSPSLRSWPTFGSNRFRSWPTFSSNPHERRVFAEELSWRTSWVFDPHGTFIRQWNKVFVVACLVAAAVDPLFFFLLEVDLGRKCVQIERSFAVTVTALRCATDLVYFLQMLLQFRVAYVAPSSRIFGRGELVVDKESIASHYLRGNFVLDFVAWLPIPQFVLWVVIPVMKQPGAASTAKNWLRFVVILQYIPRIIRMVPIQTSLRRPGTLAFETASSGFVINLLIFLLASHVIAAAWYLLGVERVDHCWRQVCATETALNCSTAFFDCTSIKDSPLRAIWAANTQVVKQCVDNSMQPGGYFNYGIYHEVLKIVAQLGVKRYFYSLWWGLKNLTSMGQPLLPSTFAGELWFCIVIAIVGMLLLAMLVGNMQKYLQSLGRRVEEHRTTLRDTEAWMKHRQLPPDLRKKVRQFDRFKWSAMHGVDEEKLLRQLPEDLTRDIKRHLCQGLVKKVPLFEKMDDLVLDAICERLKPQLFIRGSCIIREGDPVFRMLFIIRGKIQSTESNHGQSDTLVDTVTLTSGDFVGDELLTWCLDPRPKQYYPSSLRTVFVDSPVEAFSLNADDLRYVTGHFLKNSHRVELRRALRFFSPHWRTWGALAIQAAWRRYKRKQENRCLVKNCESMGTSAAVYAAMFRENARRVAAARQQAEAIDSMDGEGSSRAVRSSRTFGQRRSADVSSSDADVGSSDADPGGSDGPSLRQRRKAGPVKPTPLDTDGLDGSVRTVSFKLARVPTPTENLIEGFRDETPDGSGPGDAGGGRALLWKPSLRVTTPLETNHSLSPQISFAHGRMPTPRGRLAGGIVDSDLGGEGPLRQSSGNPLLGPEVAPHPFDSSDLSRVPSIGRALSDDGLPKQDSQDFPSTEDASSPRVGAHAFDKVPTIGRAL